MTASLYQSGSGSLAVAGMQLTFAAQDAPRNHWLSEAKIGIDHGLKQKRPRFRGRFLGK
jgi:hypothetical protein